MSYLFPVPPFSVHNLKHVGVPSARTLGINPGYVVSHWSGRVDRAHWQVDGSSV